MSKFKRFICLRSEEMFHIFDKMKLCMPDFNYKRKMPVNACSQFSEMRKAFRSYWNALLAWSVFLEILTNANNLLKIREAGDGYLLNNRRVCGTSFLVN